MRVVIVGAGPAGCAAAIELRRLGADVVLLSDGRDSIGEQLPPEARPLLQRLGLLPLDDQIECVAVRSAWRTPELQVRDFLFHPFGHGWLLDRGRFGAMLRAAAVAAGSELRQPARLRALDRRGDWRIDIAGEELRCDWILDASGRRAEVARRFGVRRRRFDRQFAVAGRLETDADDLDATLTVESAGAGYWYTCTMPGRRRIAAYVSSARPALAEWSASLQQTRHIAPLLRSYRLCEPVFACPAESSMLERTSGPGWMAIGDAAAAYDPLASRGLVAALESGVTAASLVAAPAEALMAHHEALAQRFQLYVEERARHYGAGH